MTGLLFLVVVGLWLWACVVITRVVMRRLPARPWRGLAGFVVFGLLLVAPVADEIVGGFQFRALCKKEAIFRIEVKNPEGRTTIYTSNPLNEVVPGSAIRIFDTGEIYTDVQTKEVVVRFHRYVAKGGILIRALGIFENDSPLVIGTPFCSPEQERGETVSRTLKFSVIN